MVFPVVMYGCENWTIKKAECQRTDVFELWCWRRLLRIPWTAARQTPLSSTIYWSLLRFTSIELMMLSNHLILCCPLLLLPSMFANTRVFPNELSVHIRWPKYWSFWFNNSPSNVYEWFACKNDWFDLLAVQDTFNSLLQHHSSKTSVLWHSAFFMVQFSHPYMTTGKTIALTIWTFIGKVLSLLFNILSRFVTAILPKEQASFNFMAAVTICSDFGAPKNKVCHSFHCFSIYLL